MPVLEWIGKEKVVNHANEVPFHVLERTYSYGGAGTGAEDNKIIHGDNLLALKSLLPEYEGRVKCIYIDPPYNTGEESWIYNDCVNDPRIKKWLGEVVGKEGEDLSRHDKWLCMMYPRLNLLRRFLQDNGTIFISIDDNELYNLKSICDEIFGSSNFLANFIWEKRMNRENRKEISSRHDYLLCYAKQRIEKGRTLQLLEMTEEARGRYKNPDNDPRGPWKSDPITAQAGHATSNQFYELTLPSGRKLTPPAGRCWLYTKERFEEFLADNRIWLGVTGNNVPRKKTFLYEKDRGLNPESIWFAEDVSTNESAKNELRYMFSDGIPFTTPKPHELIERILQIATDKDSIVLDSFAGSGTTAHAVLNLNKADGGNRKFILVEMMDYADSITAERVKRVIDGYGDGKKKTEGTGGDFSFYEVGEPLLADGALNEDVDEEKIRAYIWYTETHTPYRKPSDGNAAFLGSADGTAYYFHYKKGATTTLDSAFLRSIKTKAERYVIYADVCVLSPEMMEKRNIEFKKIPRDIKKI